eukprot:6408061-Amphidinium_carterae.1
MIIGNQLCYHIMMRLYFSFPSGSLSMFHGVSSCFLLPLPSRSFLGIQSTSIVGMSGRLGESGRSGWATCLEHGLRSNKNMRAPRTTHWCVGHLANGTE